MRVQVVVALVSACATTTSTCPVGTKQVVAQEPAGRAEWCATMDTHTTKLFVGRSYVTALGGAEPTGMAGGVEGPFTSWHPMGTPASHGHYVNDGARSLPDGLWTFWYANGQRRTLGAYRRGEPVGCFAVWDEHGARTTGYVEGSELRAVACTPPPDDEIAELEGRAPPPPPPTRWGDVSLQGFFGSSGIGARNGKQVDPDPRLLVAFNIGARKRLGRFRLGPALSLRMSDDSNYGAYTAGATIAYELPSLHRRLDADVSIELGTRYTTAIPERSGLASPERLGFWSPLGAAQLNVAFAITALLEAVVSARVEGAPLHDDVRQPVYCPYLAPGCFVLEPETWRVGGVGYGINIGVRMMIGT